MDKELNRFIGVLVVFEDFDFNSVSYESLESMKKVCFLISTMGESSKSCVGDKNCTCSNCLFFNNECAFFEHPYASFLQIGEKYEEYIKKYDIQQMSKSRKKECVLSAIKKTKSEFFCMYIIKKYGPSSITTAAYKKYKELRKEKQ